MLFRRAAVIQVLIWDPEDWHGQEIDLVGAVREARQATAIPECACGAAGVATTSLAHLFNGQQQLGRE